MRVHQQELAIDSIALARAVDVHASLVQDRLTERELLSRVAAGLFRAPATVKANMLQPLRSAIYAFKTDFVVAAWIARLKPASCRPRRANSPTRRFANPTIRDFDDQPLDLKAIDRPVNVLMDLEPRNPRRSGFPAACSTDSIIGPTLAQARWPRASRSPPIRSRCCAGTDPSASCSPRPCCRRARRSPPASSPFPTNSAPLMLANDDLSLFSVVLRDPREPNSELIANDQGVVTARAACGGHPAPSIMRTVTFGGRDWSLGYYAKNNAARAPSRPRRSSPPSGLRITGIICGLFGYVAYNNLRLSREIEVRIGFERRLTAVIDELNHRVKNILAVIQSIVTRTLRHGADVDVARELLIGRIHAMSNVVSLLSESQWQGVKLKGLFESRAIPHADRIAVNGPDITVSARAAQSLSLLFFELASHSDEGLSLVGKHPHIVAQWQVTGEGPSAIFHFRWEEFNTSEATRRAGQRFRPDPARPRRARSARRHVKALFHRCQLRLRTHRADANGRRHDRARPHRADFRAGAAGAVNSASPHARERGYSSAREPGTGAPHCALSAMNLYEEMADGTIHVAVADRRADSDSGC